MTKWASIIPLIGGLNLGVEKTLGTLPEFIISGKAFGKNDQSYLDYHEELKSRYFIVDDNFENFVEPIDLEKFRLMNENIDLVTALPPCGGLSMLNVNASATAPQNCWMYRTTDFALSQIKPKIFIFENAPTLSTLKGLPVRRRLYQMAKDNGYSINFTKTTTMLHGIPQDRQRTFAIFFKSPKAPILNWINLPRETYEEFLISSSKVSVDSKHNNFDDAVADLNKVPIFKFIKQKLGPDYRNILLGVKDVNTILGYIIKNNLLDEYRAFATENDYPNEVRIVDHVKYKYSIGKGTWDSSPRVFREHINAMVSKSLWSTIHPTEDRFLTIRECMNIMGLPADFNLSNESLRNHIAQNVPVNTAATIVKEALKFLEGGLELAETDIIIQNNINKRFDLKPV